MVWFWAYFLPKWYIILLPCILEECIVLFLRHWKIISFLCICTKKKEAIIHFYFFSVTLATKLIFLVLPGDVCLPVIYSELMITLQEFLSVLHIYTVIRQSAGKKVQWGSPSKTGFRISHVYRNRTQEVSFLRLSPTTHQGFTINGGILVWMAVKIPKCRSCLQLHFCCGFHTSSKS